MLACLHAKKGNALIACECDAVSSCALWFFSLYDQEAIRPFTMPLMKLTSTAIDKVPKEREKIIKNLLDFFHTDAVCCRDRDDSPLGGMS